MKNWLAGSCLLLLVSCSEADDPVVSESSAGEASIAADAPLDITIVQFPKSYFGRWGRTPQDCAMGATAPEGLISMQGSLVKFYDSTATMRDGKRESLTSMSAHFDVVGEGAEWKSHTRYRLSQNRQRLTREDLATGEKFVYERCRT